MNVKSPLLIAVLIMLIIVVIREVKRHLLFHPDNTNFHPKPDNVKELYIPGRNKDRLWAWYYSAGEGTPIVLFAHGNAGNITSRIHIMRQFMSRGISFLMFDYRGYGRSSGKTNIDTLFYDMEDSYKYIIRELKYNEDDILFAGESIGSYPASKMANKYQNKKLIILCGIHSLSFVVKHLYPFLYPFALVLMSGDLRVDKELTTYNGSTLILHSKEDTIIHYNNALENSKLPNGEIKLITIQGGHNDAVIDWETVSQFIKS